MVSHEDRFFSARPGRGRPLSRIARETTRSPGPPKCRKTGISPEPHPRRVSRSATPHPAPGTASQRPPKHPPNTHQYHPAATLPANPIPHSRPLKPRFTPARMHVSTTSAPSKRVKTTLPTHIRHKKPHLHPVPGTKHHTSEPPKSTCQIPLPPRQKPILRHLTKYRQNPFPRPQAATIFPTHLIRHR